MVNPSVDKFDHEMDIYFFTKQFACCARKSMGEWFCGWRSHSNFLISRIRFGSNKCFRKGYWGYTNIPFVLGVHTVTLSEVAFVQFFVPKCSVWYILASDNFCVNFCCGIAFQYSRESYTGTQRVTYKNVFIYNNSGYNNVQTCCQANLCVAKQPWNISWSEHSKFLMLPNLHYFPLQFSTVQFCFWWGEVLQVSPLSSILEWTADMWLQCVGLHELSSTSRCHLELYTWVCWPLQSTVNSTPLQQSLEVLENDTCTCSQPKHGMKPASIK